MTPSAGAPAAARGSLPASPKCRLQGREWAPRERAGVARKRRQWDGEQWARAEWEASAGARGSCASGRSGPPDPGGGASPRTSWTDFPAWPFSPPPKLWLFRDNFVKGERLLVRSKRKQLNPQPYLGAITSSLLKLLPEFESRITDFPNLTFTPL